MELHASTSIPAWFTAAIAQKYDTGDVVVDGGVVTYRAWGARGLPAIVLVHGGAAHAGWWDHIGPFLTAHHRVIAIDLSGHGDSGRRDAYTLNTWTDEVMAVARAESDDAPVLIGHSLGGFVVLAASRRFGADLEGVAAIDSPVGVLAPDATPRTRDRDNLPGARTYPDRESILARFRTMPDDGEVLAYIRDHVAARSIIETDQGWTWKFDPHIFLRDRTDPDDIARPASRVALIRGERGIATPELTKLLVERLGGDIPVTEILDAGHHIMLDQPIALIATLQTLLGQWR